VHFRQHPRRPGHGLFSHRGNGSNMGWCCGSGRGCTGDERAPYARSVRRCLEPWLSLFRLCTSRWTSGGRRAQSGTIAIVTRGTTDMKTGDDAPISVLIRPFQEFAARETSGGIVLLLCTVAALVWVNSPWAASYEALWNTKLTLGVADLVLDHDLHFWVNDGLMALFFFVVGLEIKRELLVGELASARHAALPILGALGGVLAPALIYTVLNFGGEGSAGWGIPMATDIAFVIGIMALLGDRVPLGLKVFLTALAIVDDIAAVLVIALFYTAQIAWLGVGAAALCVLLLAGANRMGVRHPLPYALLGIVLWLAVLYSGVHATIAGVVLAMTIPSRTELNAPEFLQRSREILAHFARHADNEKGVMTDEEQQVAIDAIEDACEKLQPPLYRLEQGLHPWVTFLIMPVFALANAGVLLGGESTKHLSEPVTLGVALGLLLGKPIGIGVASWLAVRVRLAMLPAGVNWKHIHGAAWLGGIGFTMSLFIAALAFPNPELLKMAKFGILAGSLCAGIVGFTILLRCGRNEVHPGDDGGQDGLAPG
jgi:NhaA family Na+:H+ antiporter